MFHNYFMECFVIICNIYFEAMSAYKDIFDLFDSLQPTTGSLVNPQPGSSYLYVWDAPNKKGM